MGYAIDTIHFGCIQQYMGRIDGELYDSIMEHSKKEIRKNVIEELRDELKQETYDEVLDELGKTCAICSGELKMDDEDEEEDDPVVQSAMVRGPQTPTVPLPPSPFGFPPFPFPNR